MTRYDKVACWCLFLNDFFGGGGVISHKHLGCFYVVRFFEGFSHTLEGSNRQMLEDQVFHRLLKECMKESDVTRFWMISSLMWAFWWYSREATLWQARSFFQHDTRTRGWHLKRWCKSTDLIWAFLKSWWSKYTKRRHFHKVRLRRADCFQNGRY